VITAPLLSSVCRDPSQNGGHAIRCLGSRRIVLAFDPTSDDPDLLRTVVQLLRVSAIAASSRRGVEGLETAEVTRRTAEYLDLVGLGGKRQLADDVAVAPLACLVEGDQGVLAGGDGVDRRLHGLQPITTL